MAARDDDNDPLTYALSGSAANFFDFVEGTGQLRTKEPLDHENRDSYAGTIAVTDGKDIDGEADPTIDAAIMVTITVGDVDEAPEVSGPARVDIREGGNRRGGFYNATDPENSLVGWSLAGADRDDFAFRNGLLEFRATPDYESPTDANRDNVYQVVVEGSDGALKGALDVTVTVENVDEPGTLLPSSLQPQAGTRLTTTLTDPDGRITDLAWAWESSPNRSNWSPIDGATAAAYTPTSADEGRYLRVTAAYSDGEGTTRKSASWTADSQVQAAPVTMNHAPEFPSSESGQRSVIENTGAGVSIGAPVRADDADNDPLTYSLDRSGATVFAIDERTGQLRTKEPLDRERRSSYRVTVTATDPSRAADAIAVTIAVDDIDEDPELSGASVVSFAASGGGPVARYAARDPERAAITWSLAGVDASLFSIDNGELEFLTAPDYEAPADAGSDNEYEVTVTAADPAGNSDFIAVTVRVTDVDETAGPKGPGIIIPFIGGLVGGDGPPPGPQPSDVDFEWTISHDLEALDPGNGAATGIWSDGATLWLADNPDGAADAIYAYDLATGDRQEDREFALAESNRGPRGLWSDLETLWVSDSGRDTLFAYTLATGERDEDRDVALAERNGHARGIWGDRETNTMWVLDGGEDALFAYDLAGGALLAAYALEMANGDPQDCWSDGVTLWVSDPSASPRRLFAYRLPTIDEAGVPEGASLQRARAEAFAKLNQAGNNSPRGIWSDGAVMYVADANDDKVYSYNMPDASDARLVTLALSRTAFGAFSPLRYDYVSVTLPDGGIATLTVAAAQDGASVRVEPADHDGDPANGHHVRLLPGLEIPRHGDLVRRQPHAGLPAAH